MTGIIQVAIFDNHKSIVDGYLLRLQQRSEIVVVATPSSVDELESALTEHPIDVLLLDFSIPTGLRNRDLYPTLTLMPPLLELYPDLNILVMSMFSDRGLIKAAMEAGASGYMLKDDSAAIQDLGNIVVSMAAGGIYISQKLVNYYLKSIKPDLEEPFLSHRQLEVLLLSNAFPNIKLGDLAKKMRVSNSTLHNLISDLCLKLGVNTRAAAIERARNLGLLSVDLPTIPRAQ